MVSRPTLANAFEQYGYTGKEDDYALDLTYFGGRYYSPLTGRWLSPDPLEIHALGSDLNPYAFVHGSPLSRTDPWGLGEGDGDSSASGATSQGPVAGGDLTSVAALSARVQQALPFMSAQSTAPSAQAVAAPALAGWTLLRSWWETHDFVHDLPDKLATATAVSSAAGSILRGIAGQAAGAATQYLGAGLDGGGAATLQPELVAAGAGLIVVGGSIAVAGVATTELGTVQMMSALNGGGAAEGGGGGGDKSATTPSDQRGSPMNVPQGTNEPTTINGRQYTGHALDQMQGRGLTSTVVEDAIQNGVTSPGNQAATSQHDVPGLRVITNTGGGVITVIPK